MSDEERWNRDNRNKEIFFPDCKLCVAFRNYERMLEAAEAKKQDPIDYCQDLYYNNYYDGCNEEEDMYGSPTNSSFELLDPHDPTLSRLATLLFKRTNEYLQGEIACGGDHYMLLEEINRTAITKYTDLRHLAVNLNRTLTEYNDIYGSTIRPLLAQVDDIDVMVAKLEENAYRLDSYTKQLKTRIKDMYDTK